MLKTPALSTEAQALLDAAFPPCEETERKIERPAFSMQDRIVDAYQVALTLASQMLDDESRSKEEDRLFRSAVRGAIVFGVRGPDDVAAMLQSVSGWREVVANLGDNNNIVVFQGELPEKYEAYAANGSVREIDAVYGRDGVDLIKSKKGTHREEPYYQCCVLPMPTSALTVHIEKDASGMDRVVRWFPGVEKSSRMLRDHGDTLVRTGVKPIRKDQQGGEQPRRKWVHTQAGRPTGSR